MQRDVDGQTRGERVGIGAILGADRDDAGALAVRDHAITEALHQGRDRRILPGGDDDIGASEDGTLALLVTARPVRGDDRGCQRGILGGECTPERRRRAGIGPPGLHQHGRAGEAAERDRGQRERGHVGGEHVRDQPRPLRRRAAQLALRERDHPVAVERPGGDVEPGVDHGRGQTRDRRQLGVEGGVRAPTRGRGGERGRDLCARSSRDLPARLARRVHRARELVVWRHGTRSASSRPQPLGAAPGTRPTTAMPSSPTVCPRSSVRTTETEPALARS